MIIELKILKYLIPIFSFILVGCKSSKKDDVTYFGGKIINPKGDFVFISDHNGVLDSIPMKADNTFLGKLENLQEGLYYFEHGPEFQYVYLQPKDSVLIRLNTWDFDESIVFSGTNANRNNTLIELFLQTEIDNREFYKYYGLDYTNFKKKTDSLLNVKQNLFDNYQVKNEDESKQFLDVLKIASLYPVYRKLESYSMYNAEREQPQKIDDVFFNYRKDLKLQQDSLMFFDPYSDLVITKIYNDTYLQGHKKNTNQFDSAILTNVDKEISSKKLKNRLLHQIAIGHFYKKASCNLDKKTFDTFFSLCTNDEYKQELKSLINDANNLHKKEQLPSFTLISADGAVNDADKLTKQQNAVFYFRNPKHSSDDWVAARFNYFIKKYPEINFLLVNINEDNNNYVSNLNINNQYYLPADSKAHNFLTSNYSRVVLVNKNGIIENSFAGLSSDKIESQITDLQKQ